MNEHAGRDPDDLAAWGLHCYCPNAKRTPHRLIAEGGNGKVLYAARNGARRAQLAGTDAQLGSLLEFQLLEWDGDLLRASFPVVGSVEMIALRAHLRELARPLADTVESPARKIGVELDRQGLGVGGYALVFGYALDLLLWEPLKKAGALPDTALTPERPWWNGAFWAIYPPREGSSGTNFLDCGTGVTLVMVWSDETAAPLRAFAESPGVREAVDELTGVGATKEQAGTAIGHQRRLRQKDGRPGLPIVGNGGLLDDLAHHVAEPVAALLASSGADAARDLVPTNKRTEATVIVAHELIWELTEQLITRRACRLPPAPEGLLGRMFLIAPGLRGGQ
jgi:hypothetical protein